MIKFLLGNARWLFAGFLLTLGSSFGQTFFISLSNTSLREEFGLSHGTLGLIYALATTSSAGIMLEFGRIVDRVTTRTAAMIVIAGLTAACLLMAGVQGAVMLFAAFLMLRLFGQGMMGHVAITATGRWFEARRGRAISIVTLGYAAGIALMPAVGVIVITLAGFRQAWLVSAGVLVVVLAPLLYLLLSKERAPQNPGLETDGTVAEKRNWRRRELLATPTAWLLVVCIICPAGMITALFFHQLHLTEVKNWAPGLFAATLSGFAAMQVIAGLVTGGLIDRFNARRLLALYQLPMAAGLILLWPVGSLWVVMPAMVLIGMSAGADTAIAGALWPELFGTRFLGEVRAMVFAAIVLSSAVSPLVTGYLIDLGVSFPFQLACMGGLSALASLTLFLMRGRLNAIADDTYSTGKVSSGSMPS